MKVNVGVGGGVIVKVLVAECEALSVPVLLTVKVLEALGEKVEDGVPIDLESLWVREAEWVVDKLAVLEVLRDWEIDAVELRVLLPLPLCVSDGVGPVSEGVGPVWLPLRVRLSETETEFEDV